MRGDGKRKSAMEAIRLGEVEVWPDQNCLCSAGQSVHLEPKVMAVLVMLMDHPGEVVTRQALMDTVWAGRVVGEEVLTRCISELRSALGDKAGSPRFIQTVPKRGYQLLQAPAAAVVSTDRRRIIAIAASTVLTVTALLAAYVATLPAEPTRIAILPFTASPTDSHFGAGVAEELMNTLIGVPALRVTSRTAAFARRPETDPKLIGEQLGVDALLTGALRRDENGLRISVQLVDVDSGDHLWADVFEGAEADLYSMQDDMVAGVTEALGVRLTRPLQVARTTADIDALDLYLLGRHHWHERTPEGLARAVDYFQQAIALDPELSEAYSGLADAYLLQANYDDRAVDSATALAEPLINQALALNPNSADALASRGILLQQRGDYRTAAETLARAVALNPNHSMAHMWRGNAVLAMGDLADAFEHYQVAFALDPQHPAVAHNYINSLIELGDYAGARTILKARSTADRAIVRMSAQLALEAGDWDAVAAHAQQMTDDPIGAELLRWRLEVRRQNLRAAETHLQRAAASAPRDERVYLAVLEHRTLAPAAGRFEGILASWQKDDSIPHKIDLMARAWAAIELVSQDELQAASTQISALLAEFEDSYPPFQMKLLSHLLIALNGSGQSEEYERRRREAMSAIREFVARGWGSFEFQIERGYLLAAAGEVAAAAESFKAAGGMGDLSTLLLVGDPRIADPDTSALLREFI